IVRKFLIDDTLHCIYRLVIYEHENYPSFLKAELAGRIMQNPAYSLRAFALKLGIGKSFLSEILAGKKRLSPAMASKLALRLELDDAEATYFRALAELDGTRDPELREEV